MDYNTLIKRVAEESGKPESDIRDILGAVPEVLTEMAVGDSVQTPLGTFTKKERKPKKVRTIQGDWTNSRGKVIVTLRPGKRLIVEAPP